jgi:uncharacterized membrane protein YcaP (DUF421 family)
MSDLNVIVGILIVLLFFYIKWYFSRLSNNVTNRIRQRDIIISLAGALIIADLVSLKSLALPTKCIILLAGIILHISQSVYQLHKIKKKHKFYLKEYLVYHRGKFLKGPILLNKLTEKNIIDTLKLMGITDLNTVDSIVLEADGELTIIYKEKAAKAA